MGVAGTVAVWAGRLEASGSKAAARMAGSEVAKE
jgi:hypothetical protein